jgi:predicted dehydrogenase
MGRHHARVYADMPGVDLVGVADATREVAERVGHRFGAPAFADCQELFKHAHPDLVSVAVPTAQHRPVAQAAIEAGINVLVEKPIAATVEDGEALVAAAEQAGVTLAVGHIERHNPAVTALKSHLDAGELGRIFQMRAYRLGPFPARIRDVGVIIDLASHDLDIMRFVSGDEVVRVYAEIQQQIHTLREDSVTGILRFSGGATGTLEINWLTPTKVRQLAVTGARGMFLVDYLTQELYLYENDDAIRTGGWDRLDVLRGVSAGKMIRFVVDKKEPLRAELDDVAGAVVEGRPPKVTGADALAALRLARALVESGQRQEVIDLG